jgi:hypothetical protein
VTRWRVGKPGFEIREEKRVRGLDCVRAAADSWAVQGRSGLQEGAVLAVLLRLFAAPERVRTLPAGRGTPLVGGPPALPVRPLSEWLAKVGTPIEECDRLAGGRGRSSPHDIVDPLVAVLKQAADEWALGDPESPPTEEVFLRIARELDKHGLLPWWTDAPGARP